MLQNTVADRRTDYSVHK